MWPSFETASLALNIANLLLIGSLVVGVIATATIYRMSGIKEEYWEQDRRKSNEKIADANARALEAQAQLEKFKAPRKLRGERHDRLVEKLKPFAGTRVDIIANLTASTDADLFGNQLFITFRNAGWNAKSLNSVGTVSIPGVAVSGIAWQGKGKPWLDTQEKLVEILNSEDIAARGGMPFTGKETDALLLGSFVRGSWDWNDVAPIRIIVGPKP